MGGAGRLIGWSRLTLKWVPVLKHNGWEPKFSGVICFFFVRIYREAKTEKMKGRKWCKVHGMSRDVGCDADKVRGGWEWRREVGGKR